MSDLPNSTSSFIPKRSAGQPARQRRQHSFFLLAIISYACLIAAPTASAAVFVYQLYTERQFQQVVAELDTAINAFSQADLEQVLEFNDRLKKAADIVDKQVAVGLALQALEQTTATEVAFTTLSLTRQPDASVAIVGDLITTNFDAALFQRTEYAKADLTKTAKITNVAFTPQSDGIESKRVEIKGTFTFTPDQIRYTPQAVTVDTAPLDESTSTTTTTETVETEEVSTSDDESTANESDL
jgi:hypothetical protein